MAEEKPMTVKERMAALALASSGGNSAAPTPAPQKSSGASMGTSVAERLAKMRAGSGGAGSSPAGSSAPAKKPGLVRTFTPPSSTPKVDTQSPAGGRGRPMSGGGGSSIADKIAALSGDGNSSILPPSPSVGPTGSSTPPALKPENSSSGDKQQTSGPPRESSALPLAGEGAGKARDSPRVSSGLAARMEAMKISSSDSAPSTETGGDEEDPVATTGGSAPSNLAGRISPSLAARMDAINSSSDSHGGRGRKAEDKADVGDTPPPPPALAPSGSSSSSASKMSPGLAARMGKAIPIPMPGGAMPMGGLAELKRRKQEKEDAEKAAAGEPDALEALDAAVEKKPGELQHANLSRPIISQRRRPRKSARPFKASVAVAAAVPPIEAATSTKPARGTSPIAAASPPPSSEIEAIAPREDARKTISTGGAKDEGGDPADKMNSMLRAASVGGGGDDGDDDEWDE